MGFEQCMRDTCNAVKRMISVISEESKTISVSTNQELIDAINSNSEKIFYDGDVIISVADGEYDIGSIDIRMSGREGNRLIIESASGDKSLVTIKASKITISDGANILLKNMTIDGTDLYGYTINVDNAKLELYHMDKTGLGGGVLASRWARVDLNTVNGVSSNYPFIRADSMTEVYGRVVSITGKLGILATDGARVHLPYISIYTSSKCVEAIYGGHIDISRGSLTSESSTVCNVLYRSFVAAAEASLVAKDITAPVMNIEFSDVRALGVKVTGNIKIKYNSFLYALYAENNPYDDDTLGTVEILYGATVYASTSNLTANIDSGVLDINGRFFG